MKPPRWTIVSPSAYDWEREALEFLREHLPDYEPWRAWSNLEFVDDEGRVNEVDLLVLSPAGLILVEIKSRPGTIEGDAVPSFRGPAMPPRTCRRARSSMK
jgi:hypothetical protein